MFRHWRVCVAGGVGVVVAGIVGHRGDLSLVVSLVAVVDLCGVRSVGSAGSVGGSVGGAGSRRRRRRRREARGEMSCRQETKKNQFVRSRGS